MKRFLKINAADNVAIALADDLHAGETLDVDGVRVTLRDTKMYEFLQRLIAVALPRIRDFKGINEKFDGKGNYTLGITEQIIFPEIDIDKITKIFGMEITFVTTAKTDEEAYALLREFGLPFKNAKKN